MVTKKNLGNYSVVNSFLTDVAGEHAPKLIQAYEKDHSAIRDEEMASKLGLKVTDVRTILNRLHYRGLANYQKKRNKKTGWYSYTWDIDTKRILLLLMEKQKEEINKLEQQKETHEAYSLFCCKKGCHECQFEIAAEYQFKCPECGSELEFIDSKRKNKDVDKKIKQMQKEVEDFEKRL